MTEKEKVLQNALEKLLALASCPGDIPVKVVRNICEEAFDAMEVKHESKID